MEKYIYKITNKINGKCYIGQTTDYNRRFREHKSLGYDSKEKIKPYILLLKNMALKILILKLLKIRLLIIMNEKNIGLLITMRIQTDII